MERYWTSDHPDVLYCDGNTDPVLTARRTGTATITVRNYDSSVSDQVTLTVKKAPDKIRMTKGAGSLKAGSSSPFKALATENGRSKDVSQQIHWSVSGSGRPHHRQRPSDREKGRNRLRHRVHHDTGKLRLPCKTARSEKGENHKSRCIF
ncbi:MAG: hypothetical protein LKF10_08965 [Eubacterium sp.]|jgi:hypothetical protein|nr:hypothetical protein [Eubacterium sp.]